MRRQLPAYSPLTARGVAAAALRSLARPGAQEERLRLDLAERFAAEAVVLTGSATQALQLVLAGAVGRTGRTVALPAYSCYDLVTAAVGARVRVVFYDLDPFTLTPDEGSLRDALGTEPAAVVVNGLFGFPLDWDRLRALAEGAGAVLVEDAAQGLGADWKGRKAGTFGDATVLSFGRGKGWTGGAGGALLSRAGAPAVEAPLGAPPGASTIAFAKLTVQCALGHPRLFSLPAALPGVTIGRTVYKEPVPPRAPGAFVAAAVLAHAEASAAAIAPRAAVASAWRRQLEDDELGIRFCIPAPRAACGWLRAPVLAVERDAAARLGDPAAERWGVGRGYPVALPDLPQSRALQTVGTEAPGARRLAESLFTLPTHRWVHAQDLEGVEEVLRGGK